MTDADAEKTGPVDVSWWGDVPYSNVFGDVYFSEDDGFAETCHTFVDGNQLTERWDGASQTPNADVPNVFRIGETGFGTGLNFLAAWRAFDLHAPAGSRLSFVSVEAFPLRREALLRAAGAWPVLLPYAERLADVYPACLEGWNRLAVSPRVTLTLGFGDAESVLAEVVGSVDAWFLDGFAPGKNPDMWSAAVFAQVARLSRPGTTLATFTAAGFVRRGLAAAGFAMEKRQGYGRKREMLAGVFRKEDAARTLETKPWFNVPLCRPLSDQNAIVIGGGVAGLSAGAALRRRGWQVTVFEAGPQLAHGTSGNPAPLFKPKLMRRGTPEADFYRQCYLYAMQWLRDPDAPSLWRETARAGAVQIAFTDEAAERDAAIVADGVLPDEDAQWLSAIQLSEVLGREVLCPGTYFPRGGALDGPAVCRFLAEDLDVRFNAGVGSVDWASDVWTVRDNSGMVLGQAGCVVLAMGHGASEVRLTRSGVGCASPFESVFQWSVGDLFQGRRLGHVLPMPVSFGKHMVPGADGEVIVGSTFRKVSSTNSNPLADVLCVRADAGDLDLDQRVRKVFGSDSGGAGRPGAAASLSPLWSGVRTSTPDRLPVVGPVPDAELYRDAYADLHLGRAGMDYPEGRFLPGLYAVLGLGARGFSTAYLCGDIVASMIAGDMLPVPRAVMERLHPARFIVRALRRGRRV